MVFKALLCLTVAVGFAAAKVPSYIQVCGRKNPNLDDCVIKSVSALNSKLRQGIPELDIPPTDPLYIDEVELGDLGNFKAVASEIKLWGLADYTLNHLHVDLEKRSIDIDVAFKEAKLEALYNVTAKILVPIVGKGPIHLVSTDVHAKVAMNFKFAERGGKKYVYFPSMTTHLSVGDFTAEFKTDGIDSRPLQDAINQALGSSHREIIDATIPNLEKAISAKCLDLANKICKHFTYEELFPDRE